LETEESEASPSFCEQKEAKKLCPCGWWHDRRLIPQDSKVFCFFFSKKKRFLSLLPDMNLA
jgi:hypothetical protein